MAWTKSLGKEPQEWIAVLRKDPCVFCGARGKAQMTIDHIVPRANTVDGGNSWDNFAPACKGCNGFKADMSLLHALLVRPIGTWMGPKPKIRFADDIRDHPRIRSEPPLKVAFAELIVTRL